MKVYIGAMGKIKNIPKALFEIFGMSFFKRKISKLSGNWVPEFSEIYGENREKIEPHILKKRSNVRYKIELLNSLGGIEKNRCGMYFGF